ncbi:putative uncharacterized protein C6orf52 homolog [Ornithorhynchus anatinus]|uniref:putative uncharacterized protein C6orf52 homolog n=1 Tax=Ornithorhynchus anatinus TaxID=9258 RepID=UPI0010A7DA5B|nr:putative uncharacterized protein C6orf52 homolog [Ornithorhynchus anatinus]
MSPPLQQSSSSFLWMKFEWQPNQNYLFSSYYHHCQNIQMACEYYTVYNYGDDASNIRNSFPVEVPAENQADFPVVSEEATTEDQSEEQLEDPQLYLDVEELNKEFMVASEELYDSLMNCHWQPLDTVNSKIPNDFQEVNRNA